MQFDSFFHCRDLKLPSKCEPLRLNQVHLDETICSSAAHNLANITTSQQQILPLWRLKWSFLVGTFISKLHSHPLCERCRKIHLPTYRYWLDDIFMYAMQWWRVLSQCSPAGTGMCSRAMWLKSNWLLMDGGTISLYHCAIIRFVEDVDDRSDASPHSCEIHTQAVGSIFSWLCRDWTCCILSLTVPTLTKWADCHVA